MASIRKEMRLDNAPETVWGKIRDVGSVTGGWLRASSSTAGSRPAARSGS